MSCVVLKADLCLRSQSFTEKSETALSEKKKKKKKKKKKHTRDSRERFLIGQNRTKCAHFQGSPLLQAKYNIPPQKKQQQKKNNNKKQKNNNNQFV